jgi:hypothetical protein
VRAPRRAHTAALLRRAQLGADFAVHFEAPHVVDMRRQVWAGALGAGPGGGGLRATYEAARSHAFQDRLGEAVAAVAGVVPDGMLVFLPSYAMLDALTARWQARPHAPPCSVDANVVPCPPLAVRELIACPPFAVRAPMPCPLQRRIGCGRPSASMHV